MKTPLQKKNNIYILLLLIAMAVFPLLVRSEKHDASREIGLQQIIPAGVNDWRLIRKDTPKEIDGLIFINEMVQGLYYKPNKGYLLLTLEYSSDSRRKFELHFPDICQSARGDRVIKYPPFQVELENSRSLSSALLSWEYPLKSQGALCAYWYVVGGKATISTLTLKIRQIFAGLLNRPEDSLLVRIDSFYEEGLTQIEEEKGVSLLKEFIKEFYATLNSHSRRTLYGA